MIYAVMLFLMVAASVVIYYLMQSQETLYTIRESMKLWSQRLNLLMSIFVGAIVATNGQVITELVGHLPEPWNMMVAPFAGILSFMVVSYARLASQKKEDPPCSG